MIERESMCNGCPDCVGCGRRDRYTYTVVCDECGWEIEEDMKVITIGKKHVCEDCIPGYFVAELSTEELEDDELYEAAIERIAEENGYEVESVESVIDDYYNRYEEED